MNRKKPYQSKHFSTNFKTPVGFTVFYLFPTIEFFMDTGFDDDCCLDIRFEWLFWSFTVSRYWAKEKENDKK